VPEAADLLYRPVTELADLVRAGEISARELVSCSLQRIDELNPALNAFVDVDREGALAAADAVGAGDPRPFAGVPVAIKNNRPVAGMRLTLGAAFAGDFTPDFDHNVVRRLKAAGFIVVGTTALPEWGILPTSEARRLGPTRNPWDTERTPGGSSGGSAAAVAADMAVVALGSDTGGSIRIPAALCGCVGLKPTYGSIPLDGVIPLGWSLDHAGPLARTVGDARLLFEVMAGLPVKSSPAPGGIRLGLIRLPPLARVEPDFAETGDVAASGMG